MATTTWLGIQKEFKRSITPDDIPPEIWQNQKFRSARENIPPTMPPGEQAGQILLDQWRDEWGNIPDNLADAKFLDTAEMRLADEGPRIFKEPGMNLMRFSHVQQERDLFIGTHMESFLTKIGKPLRELSDYVILLRHRLEGGTQPVEGRG